MYSFVTTGSVGEGNKKRYIKPCFVKGAISLKIVERKFDS
jgi:hypothetical protein